MVAFTETCQVIFFTHLPPQEEAEISGHLHYVLNLVDVMNLTNQSHIRLPETIHAQCESLHSEDDLSHAINSSQAPSVIIFDNTISNETVQSFIHRARAKNISLMRVMDKNHAKTSFLDNPGNVMDVITSETLVDESKQHTLAAHLLHCIMQSHHAREAARHTDDDSPRL